jgi:hypothetical protein
MCISAYTLIIGSYDLVPSDTLRHLERIQQTFSDISNKESNTFSLHNGFNDYYIYYYYAILFKFSGVSLNQLHNWISISNSVFLLFGTYQFTAYQFQNKKNIAIYIALLSCLFFLLHKGIASFSFIRYYSLSAVMVTLPAFYLCTIYFHRWYHEKTRYIELTFIVLLILFTLLFHQQETLFIAVMFTMLTAYYGTSHFINNTVKSITPLLLSHQKHNMTITILSVTTFSLLCVSTLFITNTIDRLPIDQDRVISLSVWAQSIPSSWLILNPLNQLSQVITLWGVCVYGLALFHAKKILKQPILLCGLLIPFFTVLNPIFVDIFIRIRGVDTLYRLLYITPLSVAAAYIVYLSYLDFKSPLLRRKILSLLTLPLLIIFLFPFNANKKIFSYSRVSDLTTVNTTQSLRHWADLSDYLNSLPNKRTIFTDPLTGYIITATSRHYSPRYKFTDIGHLPVNFDSYENDPFKKYSGHLLVINQRDGSKSSHGKTSGHWKSSILKVSNHYDERLINYINSQPSRLSLIWEKTQIQVFEIN